MRLHASLHSRFTGLALTTVLALPACAVDGLFLTEASRQAHVIVPDPAPHTLTGKVADGAGAQVAILGSNGQALAGLQGAAGPDGRFSLQIDGATALTESLVQARLGRKQFLALIPELPAQPSVQAPAHTYDIADLSPGALQLDTTSTTLALLVLGNVRAEGRTLAGVAPCAMVLALQTVHGKLLAGGPVADFAQIVARIEAAADAQAKDAGAQGPFLLEPAQGTTAGSLLNPLFLQHNPTDLDGDGNADVSTLGFDKALAKAVATFSAGGAYDPTRMRVLISTRLAANAFNGNCEAYPAHKWAPALATSRPFLTGGIHKDTPSCDNHAPPCLTPAQVDAANHLLGNWKPNQVPMFDDGTHGDGVAGDGIWTVQVDLPAWPVDPLDPKGVGVRLGYKFTYGQPGQGWTGSEEFPGNERHLELVDVNGDGLVTRFDLFADETGNKDKDNALYPSAGGCGTNKWFADKPAGKSCFQSDTRERATDLDADCKKDGWPPTGGVAPLTLDCAAK